MKIMRKHVYQDENGIHTECNHITLYENADKKIWENLKDRCYRKADRYGAWELPCVSVNKTNTEIGVTINGAIFIFYQC